MLQKDVCLPATPGRKIAEFQAQCRTRLISCRGFWASEENRRDTKHGNLKIAIGFIFHLVLDLSPPSAFLDFEALFQRVMFEVFVY